MSVVLGADSDAARAAESQKLLNWGFQSFDTVALYQSGKPVYDAARLEGRAARRDRRASSPTATSRCPRARPTSSALTLESKEPLVAPVLNGQPVGVVKVALEGKPVAEFPLIALEEVPLASLSAGARSTRCGCGSRSR